MNLFRAKRKRARTQIREKPQDWIHGETWRLKDQSYPSTNLMMPLCSNSYRFNWNATWKIHLVTCCIVNDMSNIQWLFIIVKKIHFWVQCLVACYLTLHLALSVRPSIRPSIRLSIHSSHFFGFLRFLASPLLPKWSSDLKNSPCQPTRNWGSRISGLVKSGVRLSLVWL